jgi:hypothetical protein
MYALPFYSLKNEQKMPIILVCSCKPGKSKKGKEPARPRGELVISCEPHADEVTALSHYFLSSGACRLVTGSEDESVCIIELRAGGEGEVFFFIIFLERGGLITMN